MLNRPAWTLARAAPPAAVAAALIAGFAIAHHRRLPAPPAPPRSPALLAALLADYDHSAPGPARNALADRIDATAAQRYATSSRLFWYTDLDAARAAAAAEHKPILALRMLGRLDDELSCANSRFFRVALYANREVSALLRARFVLYWSSERPVPVVTFDFGDGRKIVRTTTGNSIHYVLDADGRVLDALPGLYAPDVFRAELTASLALADRVGALPAAARDAEVRAFHAAARDRDAVRWRAAVSSYDLAAVVADDDDQHDPRGLARAQERTMTKMVVEVPDLRRVGLAAGEIRDSNATAWALIAGRVWPQLSGHLLDARSRALFVLLHDGGDVAPATPTQTIAVLDRFEHQLRADTAFNEFRLRALIHARLAADPQMRDRDTLNTWVYDRVFATPRSDRWLGLLPRTEFTGLPGDGVELAPIEE